MKADHITIFKCWASSCYIQPNLTLRTFNEFGEFCCPIFEVRMYLVVKWCRWKNQTVVPWDLHMGERTCENAYIYFFNNDTPCFRWHKRGLKHLHWSKGLSPVLQDLSEDFSLGSDRLQVCGLFEATNPCRFQYEHQRWRTCQRVVETTDASVRINGVQVCIPAVLMV